MSREFDFIEYFGFTTEQMLRLCVKEQFNDHCDNGTVSRWDFVFEDGVWKAVCNGISNGFCGHYTCKGEMHPLKTTIELLDKAKGQRESLNHSQRYAMMEHGRINGVPAGAVARDDYDRWQRSRRDIYEKAGK